MIKRWQNWHRQKSNDVIHVIDHSALNMKEKCSRKNFILFFGLFFLPFEGFAHSSYLFGLESHIVQTSINANLVPPGALLSLIQKGLYYTEAELSIGDVSNQWFDQEKKTTEKTNLTDQIKIWYNRHYDQIQSTSFLKDFLDE